MTFFTFFCHFFPYRRSARGNYDTETLFYFLYYRLSRLHLPYPCPTPRNMINNRERHNTRNDTPIILCQPLSTYKYSHCSARKRRKTTHPRSPVIMPHHEQGRTPPSHSPTNFQSRQYPQPQNGVCRRIRHPCAKIFAIDAAVTFDGRYMKQYQFDRCDKTA